jgi:uncharacterized protein YjdB
LSVEDDDSGGALPPAVYVSGVTVTGGKAISGKSGTLQLIAHVTPDSAANKNVAWGIVSGGEYAAVDDSGLVAAKANGTAVIRANTQDGSGATGR